MITSSLFVVQEKHGIQNMIQCIIHTKAHKLLLPNHTTFCIIDVMDLVKDDPFNVSNHISTSIKHPGNESIA